MEETAMGYEYGRLITPGLAELCIDCTALDFDEMFEGKKLMVAVFNV
jgi:hypothetical protein